MAAAIGLRSDYEAGDLRGLAKASRDARQTRRLLALAVICESGSRTEAARVGGVTLQIVRDWVLRFNAEGPGGLIDRKAPGRRHSAGGASRGARHGRRGGSEALSRRRGALAPRRPRAMALGALRPVG